MHDSTPETKPKNKPIEWFTFFLSIGAVAASFYAVILTENYRSSDPNIIVHEPTGYSISRGLFSFPSDHLIIPVEFENSGGKNAIIRYPMLTLKNESTAEEHIFYLAGEFDNISTKSFQDKFGYIMKNSFIVDPHSIVLKNLVFHINEWWKKDSPNYNYEFVSKNCYSVYLKYQVNQNPFVETKLTEIPIFSSADKLGVDPAEEYWWDFWPLYEVGCKK